MDRFCPRGRGPAYVAALCLGGPARADNAPAELGFRIEIASCPQEITSRLPPIVKLEIDVLMREHGSPGALPDRMEFRCEDDAAHIDVTSGGSRRSATIRYRGLLPEHRARALALAAAELVHATSMPQTMAETESAARPSRSLGAPDAPRQPVALAPSPAVARPTLFVAGLAELVGRPVAHLWGARVELVYPIGALVAPAITLDGALGSIGARSADVVIQEASAAAHLYFGTNTGRLRWDAAPGARFGWAHLAGRPLPESALLGQSLSAPWGGPELRARVTYSLAPPRATDGNRGAPSQSPVVALELGGGLIAVPIRGLLDGTDRVYALEGGWVTACLGVGLGL